MDKIRKALDLARAERLNIAAEPVPGPVAARTDGALAEQAVPLFDDEAITARPAAAAKLNVAPPAAEVNGAPAAAAEVLATPPWSHAPPAVSPLTTPIIYTRTRVFQPDPDTLESNRIVNIATQDPAAARFRMLRTQVLQRMAENGWRSLALLSPGQRDGKTIMAINLAVSLASDHRHTVLLVDADLRRPAIARTFGIAPEFGLDDVLQGRAAVEQCLYHPAGFDRLVILPAREALPDSSECLAGPRARAVVSELRQRYPDRIVLFDLPPVLGTDDALAFLPLVECGLVVAAEGSTRRQDLLQCMELTRRTPIVGTVLNRASDSGNPDE